jgi:hypothetical protein
MRRTVLLLAVMTAALVFASGVALALPSETPDATPMVDGAVQAITHVGTNVWVGGKFTQVKQRNGTLIDNVQNVAVFNSTTDQYLDIAPQLGGTDSKVWDMALYGDDVLIAGKFSGPSTTQKNLVLVDGTTGEVIRWYNSPGLKSVLAAPKLGRVYGGGISLTAFELGGKKLWSRATITLDQSLPDTHYGPSYNDLELDGNGSTIWAACGCDAINANPVRALVKLDTEGNHDTSWAPVFDFKTAFGHSVVDANGALYLGAGGNDFLAEYSKADAKRTWFRDTSGSTQVVEVMDGQLVVGGHFWEVADHPGDKCGFRSPDPATLDPNDECQTRKGLAAYSFGGVLDPNWDPVYAGRYKLVWALHPEGEKLHTGGEFLTVNGIKQTNYARLSPALLLTKKTN